MRKADSERNNSIPRIRHLPNRHHAECDVLRAHVVCAFHFVDFIGFGHDDAVVLQDDRVRVDAGL